MNLIKNTLICSLKMSFLDLNEVTITIDENSLPRHKVPLSHAFFHPKPKIESLLCLSPSRMKGIFSCVHLLVSSLMSSKVHIFLSISILLLKS